jgi:hypothetical protein
VRDSALGLLFLRIRAGQLTRLQAAYRNNVRRVAPFCNTVAPQNTAQSARHETRTFICGRVRVDAKLFAQACELRYIWCDYRTAISLDDRNILPDHPQRVCIKDDEHALFPGERQCHLGEGLHVGLPTEPRTDHKNMQT